MLDHQYWNRGEDSTIRVGDVPAATPPGRVSMTSRLAPRPEWAAKQHTVAPVQKKQAAPAAPHDLTPDEEYLDGLCFATPDQYRPALAGENAPVQKKDVAPADIHRLATAGTRAGAGPLPFADQIKASFGAEQESTLDGIRAHQGGAATHAAAAMGAEAYATGGSVVFGGAPTLHTAAHEAAHVVQQRGGVSLVGGVGAGGDTYERHADAVADRVVAGEDAADLLQSTATAVQSSAVQRKEEQPESGQYSENMREDYQQFRHETWPAERKSVPVVSQEEIFTGGSGKAEQLGGVSLGEAGFGAALGVAGSRQAEVELKKGAYGVIAPPVAAQIENLDYAIGQQGTFIEKQTKDEKHNYQSWYNPAGVGNDPAWVSEQKEHSIGQARANLAMLERHEFEQWYWVNSYNQWAPFANSAGTARADLIETAALMGFDLGSVPDVVRFVESVEQGLFMANDLVDAKVLGAKHDTSAAGYEKDKGSLGPRPEMKGDSIAPLMTNLEAAYDDVTDAQNGVYETLLTARTAALKNEEADDEGKLAQINEVISFWTNMAGLIDGHARGAAGLATGTAGAKMDAYANQLSVHAYAMRNWNSAGDRAQESGKATAGLQRAELERAASAQEWVTGTGNGGGMNLSISGLVGHLVTFLASGQIEALQGKIQSLTDQIGAKEAAKQLADVRGKLDTYTSKVKNLKEKAEALQAAQIANREAQYLDAGDSLDRYAVAHAATLGANDDGQLVPKDAKHEIYSTLMIVVAKIRAYLLTVDSARAMFRYDNFVTTALQLDQERRSPESSRERQGAPKDGLTPLPAIPPMGKRETNVWQSIDGSYANIFGLSEMAQIQFEQVIELVTQLLQKMKGVEAKTSAEAQNEY